MSPPWNISSVSDQQAFANTLAQAIHTIKLKPAEPTVFFGEPLEYLDWKVAFEGLIESGSYNPLQKIALLQQYLGGKAKRVVANLFQIGTEEAFKEAKRKLNDKFGKPHILTEAYRTQLEQWPLIKEHDGEALDELVNFLESCQTAMNKLPELNCLNDRRENEKILAKLPISVGNRWVKIATEIESATDRFPSIFDFVRFLSKEADVASNSLNKAIAKRVVSNRNHDNSYKRNQPIRKPEKQATAFLASENQATTANISYDVTKPMRRYPCLMCNMDNHSTGICFKLEKLPHSDIENSLTITTFVIHVRSRDTKWINVATLLYALKKTVSKNILLCSTNITTEAAKIRPLSQIKSHITIKFEAAKISPHSKFNFQ
ncbi:hypothetical protein EB796_024755 [Bugula neritina]|uniref:Uncharacterized protein n=1 Tax=Bugula neritina TaxID=10212 RepID=A0A7J7ITT9_BUGNE|nr:hypothetical protein EB796_024755 [Bugula neritina]